MSDKIFLRAVPGMGEGVFAEGRIEAGEEILSNPAARVSAEEFQAIRDTDLGRRLFVDRGDYSGPGRPCRAYEVLGCATLINHGAKPKANATIAFDDRGEGLVWAKVVAQRDIADGEQILITYENIQEYDFD